MLEITTKKISPTYLGLFAFFVALAITIIRGIENLGIPDAVNYVDQARGMIKGWSYMLANPSSFVHGLGFSASIALTFLLTNTNSLFFFKLLLAIGHGVSTYLVAKICIETRMRQRFWIVAAILFATDPFILLAASDIQTESITSLIVLYWCYLFIMPFEQKNNPKISLLLFSLSGFYSVFMRPNSLLPFLFVAALVYLKCFREEIAGVWVGLSISLFVFLIVVFEVLLTRLYSGFVFLTPIGGGSAGLMCSTEFIPQYLGFASKMENERINTFAGTSSEAASQLIQNPNLSVAQLNHELTNLGISACLANPIQSGWILILKTFALWRPFAVFGAYTPKVFLFTLLVWLPLTISAIWFLVTKNLSVKNRMLKHYFIVMCSGYTISLLLTPTQIRHRVAFAEPFYWIFIMVLIDRLLRSRSSNIR